MKNKLKFITILSVSIVLTLSKSEAQSWDGSTVNTFTVDNIGAGVPSYPTDAKLRIDNDVYYEGSNVPNNVSELKITRDAIGSLLGSSYNPNNFMEIWETRLNMSFVPIGLNPRPKFIIDYRGNVGIGKIPDAMYQLDVESGVRATGVDVLTTTTTKDLLVTQNATVNGNEYVKGKVAIGPTVSSYMPNGYSLYVEEGILTQKLKVAVLGGSNWSDFVFADDYQLKDLSEVESFIKQNKHLPEIPSADEMVEKGLDVAAMDAKLLQKIEELTLYVIQQQKEIEKQQKEINALKKRN